MTRTLLLAATLALAFSLPTALLRADESRPNVLFIAIDDLRNELGALGVAHAITPAMDALAAESRLFTRHYVQVPTCGASRAALLRGAHPSEPVHVSNNAILETSATWAERSLPGIFRAAGYRTLALGKIGHYPGGLAGGDWDTLPEELPGVWERHWIPEGPWPHARAMMHAYANGAPRIPGETPPIEAHDGPDESYPDALVARDAIDTLEELAESDDPWLFAVGFFKPHLPFAAPLAWHELHAGTPRPELPSALAAEPGWPSGWHPSGEFRRNYGHGGRDPAEDPAYALEVRRAYSAAASYVDHQVGRVLAKLSELGLDESTLVVLWSDHGFLLGEHAIWGKHCLYEESLRSPLMIRTPGMASPGAASAAVVESVDLLPTLADLCSIPLPGDDGRPGYDGLSLRPYLENPNAPSAKPALGFYRAGDRSVRTDRWRLIVDEHGGRAELFDYANDPLETENVARSHPEMVAELLERLPPPLRLPGPSKQDEGIEP